MKLGKKIGAIILILLSLAIGGLYIIYLNPKLLSPLIVYQARRNNSNLSPPSQLTSDFDPTENSVRFLVLSRGTDPSSLKLREVYPDSNEVDGKERIIACPLDDIYIVSQKSNTSTIVSIEEFIALALNRQGSAMMSGKCSDSKCYSITKECKLYIPDIL
jgi:uncharacterized protein YneF (UPF0154 family)